MQKTVREYTTFFSELLAALAIVASGSAYLYQTFWKPLSVDVKMQIASSTPRLLSILVTNEGGRDIVLTSGRVKSLGSEGISNKLEIKEEGELVKKGESLLLSPAPSNLSETVLAAKMLDHTDKVSTTDCVAEVEFVGVTGVRKVREVQFSCYAACMVDPRNFQTLPR